MGRYIDRLNRVFFNNPPPHLLAVPEDITSRGLALQGMLYEYDGPYPDEILKLNFTRFTQDIVQLQIAEGMPDIEPITEAERLMASGLLVRADVYEWLDNADISYKQKFFKCFYTRNLIESFTRVYNIHVVDDQEHFTAELLRLEKYYYSNISTTTTVSKTTEIRFKPRLNSIQQQRLIEFLRENKYVNDAVLFVEYLTGINMGEGIEVHESNLDDVAYLLYQLYQAKLIQLTFGKAYQQYVEKTLCPFSKSGEKFQLKYRIKKMERNKYTKDTTSKYLNDFVKQLIK